MINRKSNLGLSKWFIIIALGIFAACEVEYPEDIYQENDTGLPNPVVQSWIPADGTFSGIGEVTIFGENFSPLVENNLVHFDGQKAQVIIASQDSLVVIAPDVIGDSLSVKIAIIGAHLFAEFQYRLFPAVIDYGAFDEYDDLYSMAMDTDENLYISGNFQGSSRKIIKVTPDGEKTEYGTTPVFLFASGMKMGPDGSLYCARKNQKLYRIPSGGGAAVELANVKINSSSQKLTDLDFGSDGQLYASGKCSKIIKVNVDDGSFKAVVQLDSTNVNCLRVYDGYVYSLGEYVGSKVNRGTYTLYRNAIDSGNLDTLGTSEIVFEWSKNFGEEGPKPVVFNFDHEGRIFITADRDVAVYILDPDYVNSTPEPFFQSVLSTPLEYLVWGNDVYLYANRRDSNTGVKKVYRIHTNRLGAPYYGRQ